MDEYIYNYDGHLAIINFVIWLFLIISYRSEFNRFSGRKCTYTFFYMLCALTFTYAFSEADTYHYEVLYEEMSCFHERIHVEEFYYWLIQILPQGYFLWRFAIWGTALWLLIRTFKRYELDVRTVCFVFPMILLNQFAITRGCLGISLMMLSLSYLLKPGKSRVWSYIFGIAGIIMSAFLHDSLPLFIFILLLSLFPFRKSTYLLSIPAFPLLYTIAIPAVSYVLSGNLFSEETVDFTTGYFEKENTGINAFGLLRQIVDYIPKFLAFLILIKTFCFSKEQVPGYIRILLQYSYLLFYVALLFLGQGLVGFISSRTIHIMCFPLTIVVAYYLTDRKRPLLMKIAMAFFLLSTLYTYSYTIYKWL